MLKHPRRALSKLILILLALLALGILPWVDNYAHLFGFIFGFLAAYALMPFISFGHYDRRRKILLIWVCLILIMGLFALLLALFYNVPVYECEVCKLFNCVPFTRDFCASQNINFKREEPVWHTGPRFTVGREVVPFGPRTHAFHHRAHHHDPLLLFATLVLATLLRDSWNRVRSCNVGRDWSKKIRQSWQNLEIYRKLWRNETGGNSSGTTLRGEESLFKFLIKL